MMTKVGLLIALSVTCVVCYREPVCRGKEAHIPEEDLNILGNCMKEFAPGSVTDGTPDPSKLIESAVSLENLSCIAKCVLTKEKFVDEKGKISKDAMIAKINATMPEEAMEDLDKELGQCVDDHGWKIKSDAASTCTSYIPLSVCMQAAILEVCKTKKP